MYKSCTTQMHLNRNLLLQKCADEMNYCQNCSKADLLHSMRNYVLSLTEQDQSLDVLDILNELNEGTLQVNIILGSVWVFHDLHAS